MVNRQYDYQMPYGQYAYPYGSNVSFGPTCPYCGMQLGNPYGGGFGPGQGFGQFGGGFGPGLGGPGGGQCPYGNGPWWR